MASRKKTSNHLNPMEDEDEELAEMVLSNKGGPKVIHNGYMYTLHKKQAHTIRWRCVLRAYLCRGCLVTTGEGTQPRVHAEHNHRADYAAAQTARRRYISMGKPAIPDVEDGRIKVVPPKIEPVAFVNVDNGLDESEPLQIIPVMQSQQRDKSLPSAKALRLSSQSFVKQIRNIAPANITPGPVNQQGQQQPKTLVLKTIPLKVKQVAPTTIKMPSRSSAQGVPQNAIPQQAAEVCLRWNSYHSNMQNSFPSLLDSEQFVDVTLACEGRSLKCHKMILSSCSDYLAELLRENPCQHPIILMKDLKFWEVEALVKFMYRGEVNVAHEKLPQLLNAAEALQVKGLAGPSSQNSKPPLLLPQGKSSVSQPVHKRGASETKENKASTSSGLTTAPSSPKRGQKRQIPDSAESRPFTKIRLQRPSPPTSPSPTVKLEPLDIPLSPTEIFSNSNLMGLHEEEDPGGSVPESEDRDMNFGRMDASPDLTDGEDQMEFVPTDFLEQEQNIVEDVEQDSRLRERDEFRNSDNSDCENYEINIKKHERFKETGKPPTERSNGKKDKTL